MEWNMLVLVPLRVGFRTGTGSWYGGIWGTAGWSPGRAHASDLIHVLLSRVVLGSLGRSLIGLTGMIESYGIIQPLSSDTKRKQHRGVSGEHQARDWAFGLFIGSPDEQHGDEYCVQRWVHTDPWKQEMHRISLCLSSLPLTWWSSLPLQLVPYTTRIVCQHKFDS